MDNIRDSVDEGLLDPSKGEKLIAAVRSSVLQTKVNALAGCDPTRGLGLLADGDLDHLFANDSEKLAALQDLEKAQANRVAVAPKQVDSLVEDDLASRKTTGRGVPGLRQKIAGLGNASALAHYDAHVAEAQTYFTVMQDVRWAPQPEARATVGALRPEPGSADFVGRAKLFRTAAQALHDRNKALTADPVAYAAQHPSVATAEENIALQRALGLEDCSFYA